MNAAVSMRRCVAIARSPRVVSSPLLSTPSRSMAHGHGGPAKTLPPRPALPANATFAQKFEHTMWEKRHPDFEGAESYLRYYLPENYQIVYFVLGLYASIATYFILKGKAGDRAKVHALPAPEKPDYHTPIAASSDIPEFGSDAWVTFVNASDANTEKWIKSIPA